MKTVRERSLVLFEQHWQMTVNLPNFNHRKPRWKRRVVKKRIIRLLADGEHFKFMDELSGKMGYTK